MARAKSPDPRALLAAMAKPNQSGVKGIFWRPIPGAGAPAAPAGVKKNASAR